MGGVIKKFFVNTNSLVKYYVQNFILRTLFIQTLNGLALLFYYRLVSIRLNDDAQILFFLSLGIVSLAILINDFSFAISFSKEKNRSEEIVNNFLSARAAFNFALILVALFYWSFIFKYEITAYMIFLILALQFIECAIPNFIYIASNISEFAQIIKLIKISLILTLYYFMNLSLEGLYILLISMSAFFYLLVILDLKKRFRFSLKKLFFPSIQSRSLNWRLGFVDFLPYLASLAINISVPIFAQMGMTAQGFQKILLFDTLVKRCENLLQSVVNWNLGRLNTEIPFSDKMRMAVFWFTITATVYFSLPLLYCFMFAKDLSSISLIEIYSFGIIVVVGPIISIIGFRVFVFKNRSLTFFFLLIITARVLWFFAFFNEYTIDFVYVMPVAHIVLLIVLLWKGRKYA